MDCRMLRVSGVGGITPDVYSRVVPRVQEEAVRRLTVRLDGDNRVAENRQQIGTLQAVAAR